MLCSRLIQPHLSAVTCNRKHDLSQEQQAFVASAFHAPIICSETTETQIAAITSPPLSWWFITCG